MRSEAGSADDVGVWEPGVGSPTERPTYASLLPLFKVPKPGNGDTRVSANMLCPCCVAPQLPSAAAEGGAVIPSWAAHTLSPRR